jgi:hypothetical protein
MSSLGVLKVPSSRDWRLTLFKKTKRHKERTTKEANHPQNHGLKA